MTRKGSASNFYKRGYYKNNYHGYYLTLNHNHPYKNSRNYVLSHRLVYEHYLSIIFDEEIFIPKNYEIHHINRKRDQNNLLNLELLTITQHRHLHYKNNKFPKKDMSKRLCLKCNKKTPLTSRGHEMWYKYKDGFICSICKSDYYNKLKRQKKELY